MPKKVTDIFTNLFSSKSGAASNKNVAGVLASDAAVLDDLYDRAQKTSTSSATYSHKLDNNGKRINGSNSSNTTSPPLRGTSTSQDVAAAENHPIEALTAAERRCITLHASRQLSDTTATSSAAAVVLHKSAIDGEQQFAEIPGLDITLSDLRRNTAETAVALPSAAVPSTINNTQGYNVYQFSQISGLHIGSVYNIAQPPPSMTQPSSNKATASMRNADEESMQTIRRTKTIDAMMHSDEPLTHRHIDLVATHLGEGWRDIIRMLGFSDGQIEQMYEDHYARGIKEVIYGFLLDYQRNDGNACVGHLTRILWRSGRRECVYILKAFWKSSAAAAQQTSSKASNTADAGRVGSATIINNSSEEVNVTKLNDESYS